MNKLMSLLVPIFIFTLAIGVIACDIDTLEAQGKVTLVNGSTRAITLTISGPEQHILTLEACVNCPEVRLNTVIDPITNSPWFSLPNDEDMSQVYLKGQRQELSLPFGSYNLIDEDGRSSRFELTATGEEPFFCWYTTERGVEMSCAGCPSKEPAGLAKRTETPTTSNYNRFTGKTSEGLSVRFTLVAGNITSFEIEITVRCSHGFGDTKVKLSSGVETFSSSAASYDAHEPFVGVISINQEISISPDGSFTLGNLSGKFESPDEISGTYQFLFTPDFPRGFSCSSNLIQWNATKVAG